jgi:hypothetical protein
MPSSFPNKKASLYTYLSTLKKYIPANAVRLQINPARVNLFLSLMGDKTTPDTYEYFFQLWCDKGGTRTTVIVKELLTSEKKIKNLLREIFNDIPSSLWDTEDRVFFRRKTGLPHKVTVHTTPIQDKCNSVIIPLGGGAVKITCKSDHENPRASLPPMANAVEIAYKLGIPRFTTEDTPTTKVGTRIRSQIINPEDHTTKVVVTKAKFMLQFGLENAGKDLHVFVRWVNTRRPLLAGPWTGPRTETII